MNSPVGRRGAICERFGWTYDYLLHGIAWSIVERMVVDAPSYDYDDNDTTEISLTDDNGEQVMNFLNTMI